MKVCDGKTNGRDCASLHSFKILPLRMREFTVIQLADNITDNIYSGSNVTRTLH